MSDWHHPPVGVLGGGTMGRGIAQAAALAGCQVTIFEPGEKVRAQLPVQLAAELHDGVKRDHWTAAEGDLAGQAIRPTGELSALRACRLVIESVPEDLELKRDALRGIEQVVDSATVLATNTSSLTIAALASALERPERFLGIHFFNPAAIMRLVEIVPSLDTDDETVLLAEQTIATWGKVCVRAADTPGFIVNRCARPLYGEPDRLVAEQIADPATIDELMRANGFRLGPFELIDLIGLDVNLDVQRSLWEQSYGEPRWRPTVRQSMLVAAGRLGRKTGHGFHRYPRRATRGRIELIEEDRLGSPAIVHGSSLHANELRARLASAGDRFATDGPQIHIELDPRTPPRRSGLQVALCWHTSLAGHKLPGAVGFSFLPPLSDRSVVELTAGARTDPADLRRARAAFGAAGLATAVVGDGPGLVSARIAAQLANEACFALQEQIATKADIDTAMRLGLAQPQGPLEWAEAIGLDALLGLLDGLYDECREDRYRAAPLLRRRVAQRLGSISQDVELAATR